MLIIYSIMTKMGYSLHLEMITTQTKVTITSMAFSSPQRTNIQVLLMFRHHSKNLPEDNDIGFNGHAEKID